MKKLLLLLTALILTTLGGVAAEKTLTLTSLDETFSFNGTPGKINYENKDLGLILGGWGQKSVGNGIQLNKSGGGVLLTQNTNSYSIKKLSLTYKAGGAKGFTLSFYKADNVYGNPTSAINTSGWTSIKEITSKETTTLSTEEIEINGIAFGFVNTASNATAIISKIVIVYDDSNADPNQKKDPKLSFAATTADAYLDRLEAFEAPALTAAEGFDLSLVNYTSSTPAVADFADGKLAIKAAGTTTITASFSGNDEYDPSTASYILTVADVMPLSYTFDFVTVSDDFGLGARQNSGADYAANNKDFIDALTGIRIKTNDKNMRLWNDGLRMGADGEVSFTAPDGYWFKAVAFTQDGSEMSGCLNIDKTVYSVKRKSGVTGGKAVKTVSLSWAPLSERPEDPKPEICEAPVFSVSGKEVADKAEIEAMPGTVISVTCPTEGSSIQWGYSLNSEEATINTLTGENTFTMPENAVVGDVYFFRAQGLCEEATESKESKVTTLKITIIPLKGTKEIPYSVADLKEKNRGSNVWVRGYIIGWAENSKLKTSGSPLETNFVIADNQNYKEGDNLDEILPVQLSTNNMKAELALANNIELIGVEVIVKGSSDSYFSTNGLKSTSDYEFLSLLAPLFTEGHDAIVDGKLEAAKDEHVLKFKQYKGHEVYYKLTEKESNDPNLAMATRAEEDPHAGYTKLENYADGITLNTNHTALEYYSYANGEKSAVQNITVNLTGDTTVAVEEIESMDTVARFFDLNGREIKGTPERGLYIRIQGGKASKVIL